MTTPPTPAGWYPDPEDSGGLRYWDGVTWTEHRNPTQAAPPDAAAEPPGGQPPAPAEPAETPGAEHVGAHRAPESSEPEPEQAPVTEQPTTEGPLRDWTPEHRQEPTPEPAPYADATTPTPAEPPEVEPPAGTEPPAPVDNRKLIVGFGGAVAALLLVLALVAVYAFVNHKDDSRQLSSPSSTKSSATTTKEDTTTSEAPAEAPPAAGATDGPLEFTATGVDSATTVTDPTNDLLTKDAQGEFIVVHLTVRNTSPDSAQFLGTLQKLKAAGQVYSIDDEATFYVGGGFVDIPAGGQVDVGLAYDVPPGTVPDSVELHADPVSPGVELPT